jgi:hypothetical protein
MKKKTIIHLTMSLEIHHPKKINETLDEKNVGWIDEGVKPNANKSTI